MLGNLFTKRTDGVSAPQAPLQPIQQTPVVPESQSPLVSAPQVPTDGGQSVVGSQMDPSMRQDMTALSHLDTRANQVIRHAQEETKRIKQNEITSTQLLFGLLYDEQLFTHLQEFNINPANLSQEVQQSEKIGTYEGQATLSTDTKQIIENAYTSAKSRESSFVSPEDLFVSFLDSNNEFAKKLQTSGLNHEAVVEKLEKTGSYTGGKKSLIEKYGMDLTDEARKGKLDPIAGRDKEIERLVHILLRRTKNNPIIIGEAGVGKTAIVEGLAQKIASGDVPEDMKKKRVIQLDLAALVAGASHRGEFEERLKGVIKEAVASAGQIVLFIDEIHTLIGAGDSEGTMDASNIVKPYLARGQMQIIGTTTTSEYRKHFEKDKAFERRFQPVIAEEPSEEVCFDMLKVIQPKYETFHKVKYPDDTLKAAVKLSKKYIGERYLPDKAVDLMDEAGAEVKLAVAKGKRSDPTIVKSDIEKVVSDWTGIPITKLTEDESAKLLNLDKKIHERLIDQEEAVQSVSEAVRRGRIGLAAANRPIASFIFLGPTGVGKTELAKTLAEILFGRDDALVRLDMSEYMEKHEVAKLIGAPPGYVGYEEGGQLTEAVRNKPYSIVLLDEVEKAHPDVFNILLQILEDGRLTDNKGNTISFKNTIIIATSNIGSQAIVQKLTGQNAPKDAASEAQRFQELTATVNEELHKFFKPELLNRFDEIVIFKPLRMQDMDKIATLGVEKTGRLLEEQGYHLTVTQAAIAALAKEGFDPVYGARPLRRLIQSAIENPIALHIIAKEFVAGDTIVVDYDQTKGAYAFTKGAPAQATMQPQVQPQQDQTQAVQSGTPTESSPQQMMPSSNTAVGQPPMGMTSQPSQPMDPGIVAPPQVPVAPPAPQSPFGAPPAAGSGMVMNANQNA